MEKKILSIPQKKFDAMIEQRSWLVSIVFHALVFLLLFLIQCSRAVEPEELVEIEWGGSGGIPGVDAPIGFTPRGTPDGGSTSSSTPSTPRTDRPRTNTPRTDATETIPERPSEDDRPSSQETDNPSDQPSTPSDRSGDEGPRGNPDGTGDRPAGGSGGVTAGYSTGGGVGSRGWLVPPRRIDESGVNSAGKVVLSITVRPDGTLINVRPVTRASAALTALARQAVAGAKMRPLPDGVDQVNQTGTVTFDFKLK